MNNDISKKACVLGFPVAHSLSPRLHGYWLKKYNINGSYTAQETKPDQLKGTLHTLIEKNFSGCNLTLPLKEIALELMDALDDSARGAGAVNTVVIKNGKTAGYNSDGFGFVESLKAQHPNWSGGRVVILGTGGAARGIIAALKNAGAKEFVLINRTRAKAERLKEDLRLTATATVLDWSKHAEAIDQATLLVNCTSLGMEGQPPLDIDISGLPKTAAVCDIVYRPVITPLLRAAQAQGHPIIEGLPMLLHQGRLGFKHWFGADPAVTPELYNEIKRGVA